MQLEKMKSIIAALSFYGEHPISGGPTNQNILNFLNATNYPKGTSDHVPWCSAFLVYIFKELGWYTPANAAAKSWLQFGNDTQQPLMGDIAVLSWTDGGGVHFHVGIFIREVQNGVYILAGNQNNEVDIALWKKEKVLSYRRATL